mgnify:CR=1 FL=1
MQSAPAASSQTANSTSEAQAGRQRHRRIAAFAIGLALLAAAATLIFSAIQSGRGSAHEAVVVAAPSVVAMTPSVNAEAVSDADPARPAATSPAESRSQQLTGRWLLNDSIRREINIRPDGTATMDVKLDYLSSFLYGKELHMELIWKLEDGVLTHTVTSGTPEENVKRLTHDFGDTRAYELVSVDEKEMVLKSPKDGELHHWVSLK